MSAFPRPIRLMILQRGSKSISATVGTRSTRATMPPGSGASSSRRAATAKLKADAQKVVSIIKGDKAKNQIFCEIANLGEQIDQEKDRRKAEALLQKMNELEKQ